MIGEQEVYDAFSEESPVLAWMTAASVRNMIATGDRAGLPVRRVLSDPAQGVRTSRLCCACIAQCIEGCRVSWRNTSADDLGINSPLSRGIPLSRLGT